MPASQIGLAIASAMSATNVLRDVTTKRVLRDHDVYGVTFWIRLLSACGFTLWLLFRGWRSNAYIHDGGPLFGISSLHLSPHIVFFIYLTLDVVGVSVAALLYNKALQISPLSLCAPFLAFTPIFLLGSSALFLHEMPTWPKACGALLIFCGSMLLHGELFKNGLAAPALAILRDRGPRYSLLTALLFAMTNPLDKKLVLMSTADFQAFVYGLGFCAFFAIMVTVRRVNCISILRASAAGLLIAGVFDCSALLLQFLSYRYLDVLVTVSIKRAGIILSVLMGWLFFKERDISLRLLASLVMFAGVAVMYFVQDLHRAIAMTLAVLLVAAIVWKVLARVTPVPQPEPETL